MSLGTLKYLHSKVKSSQEDTIKLLETSETKSFLLDRNIDFKTIGPTTFGSNRYLLVYRTDLLKKIA